MSAFKEMEPVLGTKPDLVRISNSEIQTFKRCRRRWMLGTYYGLKPNTEEFTGPLPLGIRVHNALDKFYTTGENPTYEYTRLQNEDNKRFALSDESNDQKKVDKFNKESELGRIMLEGYVDWLEESNADADTEYVSQEEALTHRLTEFDPRVELIGKVDSRIKRKSSGFRAILDFKTAATFNEYLAAAHHSEQLMLYVILENLNSSEEDDTVDGGRYRLLKKVKRSGTAKPPFYETVDVRYNEQTLKSFWTRLMGTVRDIMSVRDALDAGEDHNFHAYPTQKMDWTCTGCPFFKGCFMLDDGSDAEGYYSDNFYQGDPNARYNDNEDEN